MYKHILAATDFSDLGDRALQKATRLAVELGARLTFLHVMVSEDSASPMYAQHEVRKHVERLEAAHAQLHAELGAPTAHVAIAFDVKVGDAATEILKVLEETDVDLLVIASAGHRGLATWLLGSTAERLVRDARKDVLVVV